MVVGKLEAGDARTRAIRERGDVVVEIERIVGESVAIEELGRGARRDRVEEILDVALEHADRAEAPLELVGLEREIVAAGEPGFEAGVVDGDGEVRRRGIGDRGAGYDVVEIRPRDGLGQCAAEQEILGEVVGEVEAEIRVKLI